MSIKALRKIFHIRLWRVPPFNLMLYLLARGAIMLVRMVPHPAPPPLIKLLSSLWRTIDRRHRTVVEENLRATGYSSEIPGIVHRIYEHFTLSLFETLTIPRLFRSRTTEPFVQMDHLENLGENAILVAGHLGNWELAGLALAYRGIPVSALARPIDNPYLDRWLFQYRGSTGMDLIPKAQAVRKMTGLLRKKGILIVAVDQVPNPRSNGIPVLFLGRPALTVRSPAILALKYNTPVIPVNIWRDTEGLHHFDFTTPLLPADFQQEADPVRALTEAFSARVEEFVRQHPEQWNWLHRRWKSVDDPGSREGTNESLPAGRDPATVS